MGGAIGMFCSSCSCCCLVAIRWCAARRTGQRFSVSPFITGLLLVAFATSLPNSRSMVTRLQPARPTGTGQC